MSGSLEVGYGVWTQAEKDVVYDTISAMGSGQVYEIVQRLLERAEDHDANGSFYDKTSDASEDWVKFGAFVLDAQDLIEYGTGIGSAWLTEDGKTMLRFLRVFGCDEEIWPDWATERPLLLSELGTR